MNSTALPYSSSRKRPTNHRSGAFLLSLLALIALIATLVLLMPRRLQAAKITIVAGSAHGNVAHGPEGDQARNCLEQHGTSLIFLEPDGITFHFLCQSDSGDWFDVVTVKDGDEYIEKSAFMPKNGTLARIVQWLTSPEKSATIYRQIEVGTSVTLLFK